MFLESKKNNLCSNLTKNSKVKKRKHSLDPLEENPQKILAKDSTSEFR